MRILIADDSDVVRTMLHDTLADAGYDVVATKDGQQAWEALCTGSFRVAILDWLMPEMSGPDICRKLQLREDLKAIYAIILTSKASSGDIALALDAGANDYIVKPFHGAELLARLGVARRIVRLQLELAEAKRLASIGELAAGIAHEINTPLQYVGDNTRFLQETTCDLQRFLALYKDQCISSATDTLGSEPLAELNRAYNAADINYLAGEMPRAIQQSLEGVDRVTTIVQAMKAFCHPGTKEKVGIHLQEALDTTITVARNEWKYVANIVTEFDPDMPPVPGLPGDLTQVILNLLINAAHAVADVVGDSGNKGTITVATRRVGDWAEVQVSDTGCGISDDIRHKIFDPFFTTKEVGKGTGQGLAIARNVIVDKHGGTIRCESAIGRGTHFIIRLPLSADTTPQDAAPA